jgi:hypothetical protein
MKNRWLLVPLAIAAAAAGYWLSAREAQILMVNDGIRITYPWATGLGALLAAAGMAGLVRLVRPVWFRILATALALATFWAGLDRLTYHVAAEEKTLSLRSNLLGSEIDWIDVMDVAIDQEGVLIAGPGERRLRIDTRDLTGDQQASLNRTIARRISEVSARASR